jgi:hypothetical protein
MRMSAAAKVPVQILPPAVQLSLLWGFIAR